jgi:periplasmic divalent cation tolerance protein
MSRARFVIVTTTVPTRTVARQLAGQIVDSRLAACVQFWPIHSIYRWKGGIESNPETILVCKTRKVLVPALQTLIRRLHSYEIPEVIVTPIQDGLPSYLEWIAGETGPTRGTPPPRLTFPTPVITTSPSRKGRQA